MTSRTLTLLGYAALAATAVGLELAARRSRRFATVAQAVGLLLGRRWARLLLVAAWLWLGWHLFVRVDWR